MPNQYTKAKELGLPMPSLSQESRKKMAAASKRRGQTPETRKKLSELAKKNGLGGHTSKRKLFFKKNDGSEIYLQSSFEIRFAEILEELSIDWCRPDPFIWIDENGEQHRYYPDFKVNNVYIDTKNDYLAKIDLPKIEAVRIQNDIDLRIVTEEFITKEYIALLV